jgi:hypothetical protein
MLKHYRSARREAQLRSRRVGPDWGVSREDGAQGSLGKSSGVDGGYHQWGCELIAEGRSTWRLLNLAWLDEPADARHMKRCLGRDFSVVATRNIRGYHGAELFIHENDDEVEFVTLLRFDSMDVGEGEFAGKDEASR